MSHLRPNWIMMAGCWLAAAIMALVTLLTLARPALLPEPDFGDAEVAVIGTSLVQRAIPANGAAGELLPDRGAHVRIGLAASSREELLSLLDQASDAGVGTILLEVNPLIISLTGHNANLDCGRIACTIRRHVAQERRRYSAGLRHLLGMPSAESRRLVTAMSEPVPSQWQRTSAPMRQQAFIFHDKADDGIFEAVDRAKARGVEIVLLLPPRSPLGEQLLPEGQAEELTRRANALADELDLPIFAPREGWSEADFVDRAHMSRQGRARFLLELREWWALRQ